MGNLCSALYNNDFMDPPLSKKFLDLKDSCELLHAVRTRERIKKRKTAKQRIRKRKPKNERCKVKKPLTSIASPKKKLLPRKKNLSKPKAKNTNKFVDTDSDNYIQPCKKRKLPNRKKCKKKTVSRKTQN
ncbi:uncharacterized protein LOC119666511 [Teleopsis dalmanni]|uniref:uncharacterized protein LOC119666511 n=1 Tax=Teleopsis dalmanni TaxID=139649 RepID=UPI0018CFCBF4|nr:uncharacterized protein LOC119666511 [Teleopsis dalmanni]